MNRQALIWTVLFVAGGLFLAWRAATTGMGTVTVRTEIVQPEGTDVRWTVERVVTAEEAAGQADVRVSWSRTIGVWIAALCTLAIFSFLFGDNVFYKLAEAVFIGVSAGYAMVLGFWTGIVDKLLSNLVPGLIRVWTSPEIPTGQEPQLVYLIPLVLGVMLLWRLMPAGGWLSRWPLAFIIGTTAGFRLVNYLDSDFVRQIQSTILPLLVFTAEGQFQPWQSLKHLTIMLGVASSLVYFFFSLEHKGLVGGISRVGVFMLMITFGAGFGYTVMGRIALLVERLEFLFDDWLWLIDLAGRR